jgi:hypothetical protein
MNIMQDNSQDNSQQTTVVKPKKANLRLPLSIIGAVVVLGIIGCLIYFLGLSQNKVTPPASPTSQTAAVTTPQNTTPVVTTPPSNPVTPPVASTPVTPVSNPPSPSQPSNPAPVVSGASGTVITRQAYTMVLTLTDMGTGWSQSSAASPRGGAIFSASHMVFTKGSAFSPVVQNTVAVYRTVDGAIAAFDAEKAANASASNPNIGNESFLNNSVALNKLLVFRKNNVLVWIQIQQDKTADPLHYAQIVDQKITP